MIVFDTSAWVEYFIGSPKGLQVKDILASDEIGTPIIALIELSCKAYKENTNFNAQLDFIKQNSIILNLSETIVLDIGKLYSAMKARNKKTSLADAIIAAMANAHNAVVVTCDSDFRDLSYAKFIG